MANKIFIDTAGWASLFVQTEPYHHVTRAWFEQWLEPGAMMVTTNYILIELVSLFTSPLRVPRPRQIQYIEAIKAASYITVIHIDADLDAAAWALLKTRLDKKWSIVDAASFVVMTRQNITQALTTDHHFEQAGFTRLLR